MMRKLLWGCAAAGAAAVCGAFWTAAFVSQNPDSCLGRCACAVCPAAVNNPGTAGANGTAEGDDLVPADPVEVDDPPPVPTPGSHVPPEVAALMAPPPIVIHDDLRDEEDLNAAAGPYGRTESSAVANVGAAAPPSTVDIAGLTRSVDDEPKAPSGPPAMPYCREEDDSAPVMPYCVDDEPASAVSFNQEDSGKVSTAAYRPFDAGAFWMGFFSGPSHMFGAAGRCEEDAHYPQQYSGCPYTGASDPTPAPAAHTDANLKPASFPGAGEPAAPPAPKADKQADPTGLFINPRRPKMSGAAEPRSDTMEMRPGDWKPYSLDPGPF